MQIVVGILWVLAVVAVAAVALAVVAGAVALLLALTVLAAAVGAVATALFTAGVVVVAICRSWLALLRDDEHSHLRVAPPESGLSGRDPGYLSYYFGPAWQDYGAAVARGGAEARDRTVVRDLPQQCSVVDVLVQVWRLPGALEDWPGAVGRVVTGGAVLGGLFGLGVGGIVVGAFLGVTTLVFAVLLGAVLAVMLLGCGLLRMVELTMLRLRGITVECPSCHRRVGVPVYECPKCQELHRRLVPGSLGVVARTCRCRAELPTLLLRGRSRLRSHCSHDDCRGVLPLGSLSVPTRHIPVIAGKVAGKTVHTMSVVADLRTEAEEGGFTFGDDHTSTVFASVEDELRDVSTVPSTLPSARLRATTFFLGTAADRRLVYLYDAAGENYQTADRVSGLRFLGATAGVLFVVDPFSFDPVRKRMIACDANLPAYSLESPGDVVGRFTAGLREHGVGIAAGKVTAPVAVVLTKCDVLAAGGPVDHPFEWLDPDEDARDARSAAVREWIDTVAGEGGLVRQLGTDYRRIGYFAVSALDAFGTVARTSARTGRLVRNDPPSAPLRWLLESGRTP